MTISVEYLRTVLEKTIGPYREAVQHRSTQQESYKFQKILHKTHACVLEIYGVDFKASARISVRVGEQNRYMANSAVRKSYKTKISKCCLDLHRKYFNRFMCTCTVMEENPDESSISRAASGVRVTEWHREIVEI